MSSEPEPTTPEAMYARWAPEGSPWSPWVKPVVFTEVRGEPPPLPSSVDSANVTWAPEPMVEQVVDEEAGYRAAPARAQVAASDRAAIVVDLPGRESAIVGLALVRRGYRPIPLFNGVSGGRTGARVTEIAEIVAAGTRLVAADALPLDAPPAFLLDRKRMDSRPMPGEFDGRWMVFSQDFPSANALRARGITRVIVRSAELAEDLTHVLFEWRTGGLGIEASQGDEGAVPFEPQRPAAFRSLFRRAAVLMGLRRSAGGGFGGLIPLPSSGGG